MFRFGRGVVKNYSTALKWIRRAAEQGYADAQLNLGRMYQFGRGVDDNDSILDVCINLDMVLINIFQQQWNGIGKRRSKAMLVRNIILTI